VFGTAPLGLGLDAVITNKRQRCYLAHVPMIARRFFLSPRGQIGAERQSPTLFVPLRNLACTDEATITRSAFRVEWVLSALSARTYRGGRASRVTHALAAGGCEI
jgi:hypothetical protein